VIESESVSRGHWPRPAGSHSWS